MVNASEDSRKAGKPFAAVVLPLTRRPGGDRPYFYRVPPDLAGRLQVGSPVEVPLRAGRTRGWVVALLDACPVADVKEITRVLADVPAFNAELYSLAKWIAGTYLCPLGAVLRALGPARLGRPAAGAVRRAVRLAVSPAAAQQSREALAGRAPQQAKVLDALLAGGPGVPLDVRALGVDRRVLQRLSERGLVKLEEEAVDAPAPAEGEREGPALRLNRDQEAALAAVRQALEAGRFATFLLHGVTGSGKTEVYLRAIAAAVALGKQAIFLVPEIALTPQMVASLRGRFGSEVAVLHSRLSPQERSRAWQRLAQGEASVAVGARSGIFAPVPRLGLIVMDEEQESSYKQEVVPRYHAREAVLKRAQLASAVVLLGSATPSLESYYRAERGLYRLLRLPARADGRPLPSVRVVDMRQELREGNPALLSRYLTERLSAALARGEQALLFLNRRGYHAFLVCRHCGAALRCRACDITLTYHREGPALRCHYCGFSLTAAPPCPTCGAEAWLGLGSGTERVEGEIRRYWPRARVLRLDADAVRRRGAHEEVYAAFREGEADILVGTQMAAKGFHFPRLTLVGVVNADVTLNLPDFRARERTFQLLAQVAGRAGRGERPGEVIVQTFFPEDYSIQAARDHDYLSFYRREMRQRQRLGYPPFTRLILLVVSAPAAEKAKEAAAALGRLLVQEKLPGTMVLGPAPAPLSRLENRYRYQLILKGDAGGRLRQMVRQALAAWRPGREIRLAIDVDPIFML